MEEVLTNMGIMGMGMGIGHTFLTFIGQAGAATQDVHAPMQAAMQADACFGHSFSHP
jgi:hypothetical protein